MKKRIWILSAALVTFSLTSLPFAFADNNAQDLFNQGQKAYNQGNIQQALSYFQQATQENPNYTDAYFNIGAIEYNLKHYPQALQAFNKLLQMNPSDQVARFETGKIYQQMGQSQKAIAAFNLIGPTSSRYQTAQRSIAQLKSHGQSTSQEAVTHSIAPNVPKVSSTNPTEHKADKPQEFANGFFGPTGLVVGPQGNLYVANYSKNTIYKVNSLGEKELFASGNGINGPVGMAIDPQTGDLYVANHLDNSIAKVTPGGKVSIIATGLNQPYNVFLDQKHHTLYVSEQETNSIAKIKLN